MVAAMSIRVGSFHDNLFARCWMISRRSPGRPIVGPVAGAPSCATSSEIFHSRSRHHLLITQLLYNNTTRQDSVVPWVDQHDDRREHAEQRPAV